mgnify:FL=1
MEQAILLTSVQVWDPKGPWHDQTVDIRVADGVIQQVGPSLAPNGAKVLESPGSMVSSGWIDGQVHFREPGEETKEGIVRGLKAASASGFTHVALLPSNSPATDHAGAVHHVMAKASAAHEHGIPARLLPMACITEGGQGAQLAEMHDLSQAGAVAFTDDGPLHRVGVLQRALTYAQTHGKTVMDQPLDLDLNAEGVMHEGVVSTEMGLTGIPSEAETLRVSRDLDILRYTGGRLHFPILTAAKSLDLVRIAKSEGLSVSCGTSAVHLAFCDEDLRGFEGTLRMLPPLRSAEDQRALCHAVLDGTIDMVVSDHRPEDLEHHDVEFMLSPNGVAGLPSAFAWTFHSLHGIDTKNALGATLRALTSGPADVLQSPGSAIEEGATVDLTWFHPELDHQPHPGTGGVNLGAIEGRTKGQVLGTFVENRSWMA